MSKPARASSTQRTALLDIHLTDADSDAALRVDVRRGLTSTPKQLPPKWFYDARGSALFEQITELPEYYPTRTERSLLERSVDEIVAASGADTLVELGSGSSTKTRLLLDAFTRAGTLRRYVPQDVSASALRLAMNALAPDYPDLALHGVVGDFTRHLDRLPTGDRRMVAFLGGTIGNLLPLERAAFLRQLRSVLQPGEQLLLGTGLVVDPAVVVPAYDDAAGTTAEFNRTVLVVDPAVVVPAYDDAAGITAEFNRNVLRVLNREVGADFDVDAFAHLALWDAENEWIEMRLRAERAMRVTVAGLGLEVDFAAGEQMRTEVSAKFRPAGIRAMLESTGFALTRIWTDPDDRFALSLATAAPPPPRSAR